MKIAIVKYNAGNIGSITNALRRLGAESTVTNDAAELRSADRVIFPGVGEASGAMESLRAAGLDRAISGLKNPVLGICLGMQLLCARSEENSTECLGVLPAVVREFLPDGIKVPHMGWNTISDLKGRLFAGVGEETHMYFVHGFYVEPCEYSVALCDYGVRFSAALTWRNYSATQFHPEKSGSDGERVLENFLRHGDGEGWR